MKSRPWYGLNDSEQSMYIHQSPLVLQLCGNADALHEAFKNGCQICLDTSFRMTQFR